MGLGERYGNYLLLPSSAKVRIRMRKHLENKRKGFTVEVEFAINLKGKILGRIGRYGK